ncbi:MAG: PatB family C-S lyase [Sulfurovum sp.]
MFKNIDRAGTHSVKWEMREEKFGTNEVLPLWVADMDLASPLCVQESLIKRASHPVFGYTIYPKEYYTAIENWLDKHFEVEITKEHIVPSYGVVASINFAINAYTQKGDKIIVQTPLYPPFVSSIKAQEREVLDNKLLYKNGKYSIDFEDFEAKAKDAKMFILCSPHNPTGRVWSMSEIEKIIDICVANDVIIVSDEIHADIVYSDKFISMGSFEKIRDNLVILNAPSKTFNIAGLNTSFAIIFNRKKRLFYIKEQNSSGMHSGNPFGIEALISAYSGGESWLEELKLHLKSNIEFVESFIKSNNIPIKIIPTEATFLMWLDCRDMGYSHKELVEFFIDKAKLGLNDGESFGENGDYFMRLNIGISRAILEMAMSRLLKAYEDIV